jgi:beta-lactamase regulating signal transducer with metallopeptidase domain
MIKKLLILLPFLAIFILPTSASAFDTLSAVCNSGGGASNASVCKDHSGNNPIVGKDGIMDKVINLISIVGGIVAVFAIVVAGLQFAISGGDPARVGNAKNTIIYVAIGLAVIAVAQIIEFFVINNLGHALK